MHEVLVNRLGGLSLPRKSVVRLTDRPDITLDVYRGRKTTMQQQQQLGNRCEYMLILCHLKNLDGYVHLYVFHQIYKGKHILLAPFRFPVWRNHFRHFIHTISTYKVKGDDVDKSSGTLSRNERFHRRILEI